MSQVERATQFDKALMGLRKLILAGEFQAGSRLPEVALSQRLEISRTPLRQALAQLVDEGLLERISTGGCKVASLSMNDIVDAIEIRGVVEGTAARLAAERGGIPSLLQECSEALASIDRAIANPGDIDFDSYVIHNARFHRLLGSLAGSAVIEREIDRVARLPLASPSAFLQGQELFPDFQASLVQAQVQHRAILEAIINREGSRAESITREHARLARKNLDLAIKLPTELIEKVPGLVLISTVTTH